MFRICQKNIFLNKNLNFKTVFIKNNTLSMFGILSKTNKAKIAMEKSVILSRCDVIAKKENSEQKQAKDNHDNICPNCHSGKDKIVNKLNHVHGKLVIDDDAWFNFFHQNKNIINICTGEINHCNNCGNQWKKYNNKTVYKTQVLKMAFIYLGQFFKSNDDFNMPWKLEVISVFYGMHFETIYELYLDQKKNMKTRLNKKDIMNHYPPIRS